MEAKPIEIAYVVAGFAFSITAVLIWLILLREIPVRISTAIVGDIVLTDAKTIERTIPRHHRGINYTPLTTGIQIPERYVYSLSIEDSNTRVSFTNMSSVQEFESGQKVTVVYSERSVPFLWSKTYIHSVEALTE